MMETPSRVEQRSGVLSTRLEVSSMSSSISATSEPPYRNDTFSQYYIAARCMLAAGVTYRLRSRNDNAVNCYCPVLMMYDITACIMHLHYGV